MTVTEGMMRLGLTNGKRETLRLLEQGAVTVCGVQVTNPDFVVTSGDEIKIGNTKSATVKRMRTRMIVTAALALFCAAVPAKADTYQAVTLSKLKTMSQQDKADFVAKNSDAIVTLDTVDFANTKLKATDVEEAANQAATGWGASKPFRIWVSLPMQGLHENPVGWDENLKGISLAANNSLLSGFLFQGYTYLQPFHAQKIVDTIKSERPDMLIGQYAPTPQVGHYFWEAFYLLSGQYAPGVLLVGPKVNLTEYGIKASVVNAN